MKTKYKILMLAMTMSVAALAQENDDMYFNSKDRAVVVKANEVVLAKKYRQDDMEAVRTNPVNPSDSYSGRGVNPEYNAQAKNGTSLVQNDPDYFVSGYQPKNVNSNLYNNTSAYSNTYYNNGYGYGSPYGYGGFGSPYSSMYSPYAFGYSPYSMMSPYGMMSPYSMYSPYGMYGMGMGSGMYSGFGMGYSMMYGSPYSMMGIGYGMGSMYGYGNYGYGYSPYGAYYPTSTAVNDSRNVAYGRHPSRTSGLNNYVNSNARNDASIVGSNGRVRDGGRMRTDSQPNYYNSGWRNSADYSNTRSSGFSNGNSWGSGGNSGWGGGGNTRSSFDSFGSGSRGSFGGGHGGGGFSGGGGGGGGGGGHSRGRN